MLWAPRAWVGGGWQDHVLLKIGQGGCWSSVTAGVTTPPPGAQVLAGPALPGLVDAHSHAFQRAFAGLSERRENTADDFWSWRDRMYKVALRIGPQALRAITAQLAVELLQGGYTQLVEFHYLQHDRDGLPYADPLTLGWAIADGAAEAGIGLTLMPALYERAGFAQPALRADQRRFRASADDVWAAAKTIAESGRSNLNAGLVVHSLRAAAPESIRRLRQLADGYSGPIHIHVSEQHAEVDECVCITGQRPIEWLATQGFLDSRWQLVHATQVVPGEIDAVAASGAGVVVCPTTEANLGDGLTDLPGWLAAGVPIAIGSDSHASRDALEELRWLEYGQRLVRQQRNVAASPQDGQPSTAAHLFNRVSAGGGSAAGYRQWGLVVGARADLLVADPGTPSLLGLPSGNALDALVFSSPSRPWRDVMVGGQWAVQDHLHPRGSAIAYRFTRAMREIWDHTAEEST